MAYLQRFENAYPEQVLKSKKTKKSIFTLFPITDFFHIATQVGALGEKLLTFYEIFGFITKKKDIMGLFYVLQAKTLGSQSNGLRSRKIGMLDVQDLGWFIF